MNAPATPHQVLPVAVLIPTRNCVAQLAKHLQSLNSWISQAEQVVVVDSFSTDGTYELLREQLRHPRLQFHQRPPGLYECWNFGVEQITSPWTYISTTGDLIQPSGCATLLGSATQLKADVVISPPEFRDEQGQPVHEKRWPIHEMVERHGGAAAIAEPWEMFLQSFLKAPQGMLGSSAANLYRTDYLRAHPFPTDYGHFGDTAWAISNAFHARIAILPEVLSSFCLHQSGVIMAKARLEELRDRLFELGLQALSSNPDRCAERKEILPLLQNYPAEFRRLRELDEQYATMRKAAYPWIMNPAAWKTRAARNRQRTKLDATFTNLGLRKSGDPSNL